MNHLEGSPPQPAARPDRRVLLAALVLVPLAIGAAGFYLYFRPFQPASLSIVPAEIALEPTRSQRFVAKVADSLGNVLSVQPQWSSTGGETDATGLFTAGTRSGRYEVRASLGELRVVAPVTIVPGPPAALDLTPAAIGVDVSGQVQISALVRDQWENAISAPVLTWGVSPASVGTITSSGLFVASPTSGSGKVSVTTGSVTKNLAVTVRCPTRPTVGGLTFNVTCTAKSDVYVHSSISGAPATVVARAVDPDVAHLEREFGREFKQRPLIYVFGSTQSYADGLNTIFHYDPADAQRTASRSDAAFPFDPGYAIVINWERVRAYSPMTALRHELTHMMIQEIVGPATPSLVPTWLNEGLATLQEFTIPGSRWDATTHRYAAASMTSHNALFSLDDLTALERWRESNEDEAPYQYYASTQAVQFLFDDIGMSGVVKLIDAVAAGTPFVDAFRSISGKPFEEFAAAYPTRVRALASAYPGVATAPDTARGPGLSIVVYGFAPSTVVTISVASGSVYGGVQGRTDRYGVEVSSLGSDWPSGTYTITARGGGRTATTTARK
jgi:hypothetical protein